MFKNLLLIFVTFISSQVFAETYHIPAVAFRPQFHYDTSSTVSSRTVAMPRYLGQSWTNWSMHPTPVFPVSAKMDAVVRLPDNAFLHSLTCTIYDKADTTANFTSVSSVRLKRVNTSGERIESDIIANSAIGSRPNLGVQHIRSGISTIYSRVDNDTYAYIVTFEAQINARPSWFDLQFRGCRIDYN